MPSRPQDAPSTLDAIAQEAQRGLRERPSISIRTRITIGFLLWLVLSLGIAIISILTTSRIQSRLYFLEATARYTFEIQQARRYEKNYFLYHTNLEDALEHVHNARALLARERDNIVTVVGPSEFDTMNHHLIRYEQLIAGLKEPTASPADQDQEFQAPA